MGTGLIIGELAGLLSIDDDPFVKGLDRSMRTAEQTASQRMGRVGATMTKGLTVPLAAIGVASVKMSVDLDTAFARMVGLAGVGADEVDGLKASVMDLAGETAVAPAELADALYFAASAGLDAAGAMDAVKVAAQGSAAGLGSTVDIVGLVASATAAYGSDAIDAAKATDILTATIRAGRADPDELAGSLGRILPFAQKLGVTFDEVGGTVAYLSNLFGDTNRAVTAAQGVFVKLQSPTAQGRAALEQMGTSVEELQSRISKDGLLGAFELLREKGFAGNQQAMTALFDDIEARSGAMAVLEDKSGQLAATFDDTRGSAGDLAEALGVALGTDGHKARQTMVDLQVALIEIGNVLIPLVSDVTGFASALLRMFSDLPGPVQTLVVAFGGLLAAVGPLLWVGSRLKTVWNAVDKAIDFAAKAAYSASGNLGKLAVAGGIAAVAIAAVAMAINEQAQQAAAAQARIDGFKDAITEAGDAVEGTGNRIGQLAADAPELASLLDEAGVSAKDMGAALAGSDGDWASMRDRLIEAGDAAGLTSEQIAILPGILDELRGEATTAAEQADILAGVTEGVGDAAGGAAGGVDELTGAEQEQVTATEELTDAIEGLVEATLAQFDSNLRYRQSIDGVEGAMAELKAVQKEHGTDSEEYRDALLEAEGAMQAQAEAVVRLYEDTVVAAGGTLDATAKAALYREELAKLAGGLAEGSPLRKQLEAYIATLDAVPAKVNTLVSQSGVAATIAELEALARKLNDIPGHVRISVGGGGGFQLGAEAGGLVGPNMKRPGPTDTVAALLAPGEYVVDADTVKRWGVRGIESMLDGRSLVGASQGPAGRGGEGMRVVNANIQVVANNPAPEPTSTSIHKASQKIAERVGRG